MCFFFLNDPATTEIYTLSLHDPLPFSDGGLDDQLDPDRGGQVVDRVGPFHQLGDDLVAAARLDRVVEALAALRSEEHTSELQSRQYLVCRLLLEKKK